MFKDADVHSIEELRAARRTAVVRNDNDEGEDEIHRIPDRADEQRKEAEIVPLLARPEPYGLIGRQENLHS